jgi:DNA gyrase subunit A
LDEGDHLIGVAITDGTKDILLLTDAGKANRFKESDVRAMGRTARGVRGIRIQEDQNVISLVIPEEGGTLLTASDRGYGKRTDITEFPTKGRGTQGVKAMVVNERNGVIIGAVQVFENDEVMLISDKGTLVRTSADSVSCLGRNTQGVRLIKVAEKERLIGVERVCEPEEVDDGLEYLAADGTEEDTTDSIEAQNDTDQEDAGQEGGE